MKGDTALMQALEVQLMSEYYPDLAARLKSALESGDSEKISKTVESVTTAQLHIDSVKASSPLFNFSSTRNVVVKVTYSLIDAANTTKTETLYYLYSHGGLLNAWSYQYETSALKFYLNFL